MSGRRRRTRGAKPVRQSAPSIVSTADLERIRLELERVSKPGTDPIERASVITWALSYSASYFRTARGNLRRVFPKGKATIDF
jgi:hypothetical protein